jgi:putative endonuclease
MKNKDTGNQGENMAVAYLVQKGYTILHQNWRYKYWEIDIIAQKNNCLHIVEVKTRNSIQFGFPEESISEKKMNALKKAAIAFLEQNLHYQQLQFDVVAVTVQKNEVKEIFLIEDVFF